MINQDPEPTADPAVPAAAAAPVDIAAVIRSLPGPFQQRDLVTANDTVVRIALFEGEFPWHEHEEDELFLCWDGDFRIELDNRDPVPLSAGQLYVVPKGLRHRPVAERRAHVLMIERPETAQYGK